MSEPSNIVFLWITGVTKDSFCERLEKADIHFSSLEQHDLRDFTISVSPAEAIILCSWNGEVSLDRDCLPEILSISRKCSPRGQRITNLQTFLNSLDGCVLKAYVSGVSYIGEIPGWDYFEFLNTFGKIETVFIRSDVYEKAVILRWEFLLKGFILDRRISFYTIPMIFFRNERKTKRLRMILRQYHGTPRYWRFIDDKMWQLPMKIWHLLENIMPTPAYRWDSFLVDPLPLAIIEGDSASSWWDHQKVQILSQKIETIFYLNVSCTKRPKGVDWLMWAIDTLASKNDI